MDNKYHSFGEVLIDIVKALREDKTEIIVPYTNIEEDYDYEGLCSRVALAVKFTERSKGFQLRALVENWDARKIVKEMF